MRCVVLYLVTYQYAGAVPRRLPDNDFKPRAEVQSGGGGHNYVEEMSNNLVGSLYLRIMILYPESLYAPRSFVAEADAGPPELPRGPVICRSPDDVCFASSSGPTRDSSEEVV